MNLKNGMINLEVQTVHWQMLYSGTHESLVEATNFVKTMEEHQHRKIGCPEEIAYLNGWISREEVMQAYEMMKKNEYGRYLKDVVDGKYIEMLKELR